VRVAKLHNTFDFETQTDGGQMAYTFLYLPAKTDFYISIHPSFLLLIDMIPVFEK